MRNMHTKPSDVEREMRAQTLRSTGPVARAQSTQTDIERAEGEGLRAAQPPLGAASERHLARHRALTGRVMAFDLGGESTRLSIASGARHTTRTLAKLDAMRLALMKLESGSAILEHRSAHQISIHVLSGHVVLNVEGRPLDMPTGHVVVLERGVAHDIVAKEASSVLLTVSAPSV
jgi:quercetin dioxygenase-like cupin family protein